jgi:AcrR family transcriptional regulator
VPRPPDHRRRQELLDAVIADCAAHGLGNRSLRDIAANVGTSHRMLIHHFGSREELMVAVVEAVETRQRAFEAELAGPPVDALLAMWRRLSDPQLRPLERLFFECYARGANGEAPFDRLLPGAVHSWLQGVGDPAMRRLGLAVVRGLLLDLAGTDDEDGAAAALTRFVELLEASTRPTLPSSLQME